MKENKWNLADDIPDQLWMQTYQLGWNNETGLLCKETAEDRFRDFVRTDLHPWRGFRDLWRRIKCR